MMLAAATYRNSQNEGAILLLVVMGIAFVLFVWFMCYLVGTIDANPYRKNVYGVIYDTRKAHRILGRSGEMIVNGQAVGWMQSLWRTYDLDFFLVTIIEVKPPTIEAITATRAEKWIIDHAELSERHKLIREWLSFEKKTWKYSGT